jgi:hypothetical protein
MKYVVASVFLLLAPAAQAGQSEHLPIGKSDHAILSAALHAPAVQAALNHCKARGYLRHATEDIVVNQANGAAVIFALEKPNLQPPTGYTVGEPLVVVATYRDAVGTLYTEVVGGIVVANETQLSTSEMVARSDPYFRVAADGATIVPDESFEDGITQQKFMQFLSCAGWSSLACMLQLIGSPIPIPQVIVIRIIGCQVIATISCMTQFLI